MGWRRTPRRWTRVAGTLLLAPYLLVSSSAPAQDPPDTTADDLAFLDQLERKGLDRLAEAFCQRQWAAAAGDPARALPWAVRLAERRSRRAAGEIDPAKRRAEWKAADALLGGLLDGRGAAGLPGLDARLRYSGLLLDRARLMADLAKVLPDDAEAPRDALAAARQARDLLERFAPTVRAALNGAAEDLPRFERLTELSYRGDLQRGLAWTAVAANETDPAAKAEAVAAAERLFKEHTREFQTLPLNLESFLGLADLYRKTGRPADGLAVLAAFDRHPETPPPYRARAALLQAQLCLQLDPPDVGKAFAKLDVPADRRVQPDSEWNLALFEALLRGATSDPARQKRAMEILDSLEARFGRYWLLRGEQVLARLGGAESVGDNPAVLRRVAGLKRARREWDQAADLFERSAKLYQARGETEPAARAGYDAALARFEKRDYAAAAAAFETAAAGAPASKVAPPALLGAALAYGELAKTDRAAAAKSQQALQRLLERHPTDPAAADAHWLLGGHKERAGDWQGALTEYRAVAAGGRLAASLEAIASIVHDQFLPPKGSPAQRAGALAELEQRLDKLPASADPAQAKAAALARYVVARLLAETAPERLPEAMALLKEHVVAAPGLSPALRGRAWQALLRGQTQLGRPADAAATARSGFSGTEADLLAALTALTPTADGLSPAQKAARAAAVEAAAERIFGQENLSLPNRRSMQVLLAQAYAAKGDHAQALRLWAQLRDDAPRDPRVLVGLAETQTAAGRPADAAVSWGKLVQGLPRGGPEWTRAVLELSRCQLKAGEPAKARKTIDHLQRVLPDGGTPETRARIEAVRREIVQAARE